MTTGDPSRRKFITVSALALGARVLPLSGADSQDQVPGWVSQLESALQPFTSCLRSGAAADGAWELCCTMPDLAAFGAAPANLAGLGYQAKAAGNCLTLARGGVTVRIILQHGGQASPEPALS